MIIDVQSKVGVSIGPKPARTGQDQTGPRLNWSKTPDRGLDRNGTVRWNLYERCPEECYGLIENMTAHHNDWDTSAQRSESSSSITSSFDLEIIALKAGMAKINKNLMKVLQINQQVKAVTPSYETYGGPHSYNDCPTTGNNQGRNQFFQGASHGSNPPPAYQALGYQAPVHQPLIPQLQAVTTIEFTNSIKANDAILKNMQTNMTSLTNSNLKLKNMFGQFMKMNTALSSGSGTLPSNTVTNPKEDLKVKCETEVTKDTMPHTNNESTKDVQPPVVHIETLVPNSKPVVVLVLELVAAPVSASKPNQKPSIPYLSRLYDQNLYDKANDQKEKFFQIFQDLNFNISFADALILMPRFGPTIKKKPGDPDKFLIPCDFPGMDECLALTDLGASINLMPLSVWNKLSLPELTPTLMTLELADRSISRPTGVAEDVYVKVGKFHFLTDFVVVDFNADPRVPLILGRSFLKTGRALIDVYAGELTLRVNNEAVTFNLDQTSRYSANYNDMTVNQINVIDMDCEEYSQEVLSFSDVIASGNLTPYYDPIVSTSSPTLTLFWDSDFLLEEVDAFLALEDDSTSPKVDHSYYDTEGDILLLEAFFNDDPSLPPPNQGMYLPQVRKELKICEAKSNKSLIDEPPKVELKDLPPHLEYAFLERMTSNQRLPGDDANKHLDKLLHVTQSIKVNGITDDALRLYLFPHSLTHHATAWFDRLPRNSINTIEQMAKMFLGKYFPPFMVTKLRNEIINFRQHPDESLFEAWERYKLSIDRSPNHNMLPVTQIDTFYNGLTLRHRDTINAAAGGTFMKKQIIALKAKMAEINKNLMKVLQINHQVKAVTPSCETCGGPHSYNDCPATVGQTQNVYAVGAYQGGKKGCASWVLRANAHGEVGVSFGTVSVYVRVQESEYGGGVFLVGK
nr:reverse transcriptase domain-containing protein [Tanacetum cinerariifolium]